MPAGPPSPKILDDALKDALGAFPDGINMGVDPLLLPSTQLAYGLNLTVRGTLVSHRPAYNKIPLTFANGIQAAVEAGLFQGACYYQPDAGLEALIATISGRLYKFTVNGATAAVTDITPQVGSANITLNQSWLWQSENFVIRQDGSSRPVIYDGTGDANGRARLAYNGLTQDFFAGTNQPTAFANVTNAKPFTIQANGVAFSMTLDANYTGANNKWIFMIWTDSGLNYGVPLLVTAGTGTAAITVKNMTNTAVVVPATATGVSVKIGNYNNIPYPAIGDKAQVLFSVQGGTGVYRGPFGVTVQAWSVPATTGVPSPVGHFRVLQYVAPGNTPQTENAQLKNISDTQGTFIVPGTSIIQTTSTSQLVKFASTRSDLTSYPGSVPGPLTLSDIFPGSNGDTVYINGNPWIVTAGAGTKNIMVQNPTQNIQLIYFSVDCTWYQTITNNQTIGVVAAQFTVPAIGSTVNVTLTAAYSGPALNNVVINGAQYQISQYSPQPVTPGTVYLLNLDIDPGTLGFNNNPDFYTYFSYIPEVPVGKMGAYSMGRNWMALANGRTYWASDLVGSSSGIPSLGGRDAVLKYITNTLLQQGGNFIVPGASSNITAIIGTTQLDTSLGQGPLAVLTNGAVYSNQAPPDNTTWASLTFPIQTVSLSGAGALSQESTQAVNGDTIFRSIQGLSSLIIARRDFNVWGNVPISREVGPILAADSPSLLGYCKAIYFDNRYLVTASPTSSSQGVYHTGIIALDFDPLSSLRGKLPAVYDGLWTGLNVLHLLKGTFQGVERAFAFHLNIDDKKIELWEITSTGQGQFFDNNTTAISFRMEGPGMNFGQTNPKTQKLLRLVDGEINIDSLIGTVHFQAFYKPDQYPNWIPWYSWDETASGNISPNFRPRIGLGEPSPRFMDPSTNRPMREAYTFQFALVITGQCRFRGARFWAVPLVENQIAKITPGGVAGQP